MVPRRHQVANFFMEMFTRFRITDKEIRISLNYNRLAGISRADPPKKQRFFKGILIRSYHIILDTNDVVGLQKVLWK